MEWVETTAKTLDEAKEMALDRLGVGADEAEFDVIEEPRPGLFGRLRGEARLRARVKPAQVRPKQERRRRKSSDKRGGAAAGSTRSSTPADTTDDATGTTDDTTPAVTATDATEEASTADRPADTAPAGSRGGARRPKPSRSSSRHTQQETTPMSDDQQTNDVSPQEVGDAAVSFMDGLTGAFGADATSTLTMDGLELEVNVDGRELGLLVGPGGRTLNAIQDLARVAAQRRLGDHETRLRIDVAGYRERREAALANFATDVAEQVRSSGTARSLEPMTSADRKVVHDVLNDEDGVTSRSEGDDPNRRIIVEPA